MKAHYIPYRDSGWTPIILKITLWGRNDHAPWQFLPQILVEPRFEPRKSGFWGCALYHLVIMLQALSLNGTPVQRLCLDPSPLSLHPQIRFYTSHWEAAPWVFHVGWRLGVKAGGLDPIVCNRASRHPVLTSNAAPSSLPAGDSCYPASCFCLSQIARALCILGCWVCLESPPTPHLVWEALYLLPHVYPMACKSCPQHYPLFNVVPAFSQLAVGSYTLKATNLPPFLLRFPLTTHKN